MRRKPTWHAIVRAQALPWLVFLLAVFNVPAVAQTSNSPPIPPLVAKPVAENANPLPPLPPDPASVFSAAAPAVVAAAAVAEPAAPVEPITALRDGGDLTLVGCATCGGTGNIPRAGGVEFACSSCGGSGCVPGRKKNQAFHYHTFLGRFFGNLYECLCCPDPCYEPSWVPEANAAFFVDYAKPRTIQRIRYDHVSAMPFPDRSTFFWARENLGKLGAGTGPGAPKNFKNFRGERSLDFDQLSFYQEAATEKASVFVEIPYRAINPVYTTRHSGFSDMNVGTKALFFDCELLQLAFQFRTYIPIGSSTMGLGTGHVSLEPSLLGSLRLAPQTYFQGQLSEWIPIGGDPQYQGSILHYHFSFNQVIFRLAPESPVIGTFEFQGWSFQTGSYTDPSQMIPARYGGGQTYFSLGPGLRTSICNNVDFGGAVNFPVTNPNMGEFMLRIELRVLY